MTQRSFELCRELFGIERPELRGNGEKRRKAAPARSCAGMFDANSDLSAGNNVQKNKPAAVDLFRRPQQVIANLNQASDMPLWNYARQRHGNLIYFNRYL
jgi:hypothetical protein